jgi:uncharacterized damage-inducible protein DinB
MEPSAREQRVMQMPTGYDPVIAPWAWMLEDARRRTKQAVAELSDAALDWTPPEANGNSIGTLLYHIMAIEMSYLYEDMLQVTAFPQELAQLVVYDVRDEHGQLTVVRGEPLGIHLLRFDAARALLLKALRTMTPTEFRRVRTVENYDITPECALHHLLQHEAEHRGQIMELRQRAGQAGKGIV